MPIIRKTRIDPSGNVGIGTNLPQYKLQVVGNTLIDGNLSVTGQETIINTNVNNTERLEVVNDGTGPAMRITQTGAHPIADFCDDASNNTVVRIADTGNVGIGTITPIQKLDVSGNTNISGNITANNLNMYRNRVINGDFRIDQRNFGYASTAAGTFYNGSGNSVDRWKLLNTYPGVTINHDQITLSTQDDIDTGGNFTNAITLSVNSPIIQIPFDNSITDIRGFLSDGILFGATFSTSPVKIGSHCINCTSNTPGSAGVSYVTYPAPQMTLPISVSFWIYFTAISGGNQVIGGFGSSSSSNWSFEYYLNSSGQLVSEAIISGTNYGTTGSAATAITVNTWYHVCSTITVGGALVLYINGVPLASVSISIGTVFSNAINIFRIGAQPISGAGQGAKCYVDDFRVYGYALNGAEIAYLAGGDYSQPLQLKYTVPSTPLMYYPFDSSLNDATGNGNTWTVTGSVAYVSGFASSTALYLANEANVIAVPTAKAANYLTMTYNYTSSITISFWVLLTKLPQASGQLSQVFYFGNTTTEYLAINFIYNTSTTASLIAWAGNNTGSFIATNNTWYHVTAIFIPSVSATLYVNGTFVSNSVASNGTLSGGTLTLGEHFKGTIYRATAGYIDDFRLYNRVLTASEIANLYNSYTPIGYTLYQQPIEGYNISDLAWGTNAAQPITVSSWIKNNTPYAQQFTYSINNNSSLIAYMPMDNDYSDLVGTVFTQPVRYGTPTFSNSVFKVGTYSIFFPNTAASTTNHFILYTVPANIQPQTISIWFNPSTAGAATGSQIIYGFGSTSDVSNNAFYLRIQNNTSITAYLFFNGYNSGSNYFNATYNMTINTGTWYHCVVTYTFGGYLVMYINGVPVATNQTSATITTKLPSNVNFSTYTTNFPVNYFQIGGITVSNTYAYNGYVDDVRIYNRPLTAAEVLQLYNNNASVTTPSTYLLNTNRCYLAQTPLIPANTWRKISITIPGETTGYWNVDINPSLFLSICLGANATFANAANTWLTQLEFTVTGNQILNDVSNNFTGLTGNSITITGVQLERGNMASTFDYRSIILEKLMVPTNISFFAYWNGSVPSNITGVMPYNTTLYNYGNGYNTTTNTFTAPINGMYMFTATAQPVTTKGIYFQSNQFTQAFGVVRQYTGTQEHVTTSITIQLNAGSYIWLYNESGTVNVNNFFSGTLLFAI